jgi:hypothetical protein
MVWSRCNISIGSFVSVDEEGVHFAVDVFGCNLEAIETLGYGAIILVVKLLLKFLLAMPLEAMKNART